MRVYPFFCRKQKRKQTQLKGSFMEMNSMWIYEKNLIFIFAPAYEWKLILNFEAIILKLVALYYVSWVYLEIIGNLQHDKEIISIAKNTRALKKQIFTEMLLLDCWISFITNQVLIELLHICGKSCQMIRAAKWSTQLHRELGFWSSVT